MIFDTRQKKNLTTKAIHAVNVTCFYGGVFKYFEHHFHHCQIFPILLLWANVKCSSVCIPCTLRLNDAVVHESESSWGEWVFLIWNFSCNFIIIICSFLSAKNNASCTLQINQEKHLILPKLLFALCQLNELLHVFNANEVRLHSKITFQFFQYLDPNLSNSLLFDRQWDPLTGFGR